MSRPATHNESIGTYDVFRTIGEGAFSKVKLALHRPTKCRVALKIVDNKFGDQQSEEMELIMSLKHQNIIQVFQRMQTVHNLYIVMEYAVHGDLGSYALATRGLKEDECRCFFKQIVEAVAYIHGLSIAHRDLKPENILLFEGLVPKICDFGLSKRFGADAFLSTGCGSLPFSAPELFNDSPYDATKVDVWALGVILFFLQTACLPFETKINSIDV